MLVIAYIYMTYVQGVIVSVVIIMAAYAIFQVWIYVKNEFFMPNSWALVNILIGLTIMVSSIVVSFFVDEFRVFTGFSIAVWVLAALLLVYAFAEIISDLWKIEKNPIFFSPWVFPIYIYNSKKNDVESHNRPSVCLITGLLILILWSVLASVWV